MSRYFQKRRTEAFQHRIFNLRKMAKNRNFSNALTLSTLVCHTNRVEIYAVKSVNFTRVNCDLLVYDLQITRV